MLDFKPIVLGIHEYNALKNAENLTQLNIFETRKDYFKLEL